MTDKMKEIIKDILEGLENPTKDSIQPYATVGQVCWQWWGKPYTFANNIDHLRQYFLPDFIFDELSNYERSNSWSYTYCSKQAAINSLRKAITKLQGREVSI